MRPTTTLAKSALGSALHATDVARAVPRRPPRPTLPDAAAFTIATIGHWFVAERSRYLVGTIDALRRQTGAVSIAIVTNEPERTVAGLGPLGADVVHFDDVAAAAGHLVSHPDAVVTVRWTPPRRRTHPYELTWGHKALMRSIAGEHAGFARGLTHLAYLEDDLALADGAFDYWVDGRRALEPFGLLPGFVRWEGRGGDRRVTDQLWKVRLAGVPTVEAPLTPGADAAARWVNLPNPYQGWYLLDAPLAASHLATSRFLSPARSLSGAKRWGRELGVRERAAMGPIGDDVPSGFTTRNVVPLVPGASGARLHPACLVEHQPTGYLDDATTPWARIPLDEVFVDDRRTTEDTASPG